MPCILKPNSVKAIALQHQLLFIRQYTKDKKEPGKSPDSFLISKMNKPSLTNFESSTDTFPQVEKRITFLPLESNCFTGSAKSLSPLHKMNVSTLLWV